MIMSTDVNGSTLCPTSSIDAMILAAMLSGDAYVFSTTTNGSIPAIAAGNFLNIIVKNNNPTRKVMLFERRFDNNVMYNSTCVVYGGIPNPVLPGNAILTSAGSNLNDAYGPSPDIVLTSGVYNTRLDNAAGNAVPSSMGYLPVGDVLRLVQPRILGPNKSFGMFVAGQASGLAGSGSINANVTIYALLLPNGS